MCNQWRSNAAQTFLSGRLTQIDGYWGGEQVIRQLFEMISDWDLWGAAFGPRAPKAQKRWTEFLAMRTGEASKSEKVRLTAGAILGKSEQSINKELFSYMKEDVIHPLDALLKTTPLTINFNAESWFGSQAGFDEYITAWGRRKTNDALNLNPDRKNPSDIRAKADRWALYGQFNDGKANVINSGLRTPHVKVADKEAHTPTYNYSHEKHKDGAPIDSQVFAALNYGRRLHGASTQYGWSVFELADGYKKSAIYFAMDTFTPVYGKQKAQRSKLYQVNSGYFGGAILLAIKSQYQGNQSAVNLTHSKHLATDLLEAARVKAPKPDNSDTHLLIEAHLFNRVLMKPDCVSKVKISKKECVGSPMLRNNTLLFTRRTGIPVEFID